MAPRRGADRGPAFGARTRAHTPVADPVQEDTTVAIRPRRKRRKRHPIREPYEVWRSLLLPIVTILIYDAVTRERIMKRCQESLVMQGATPKERRQVAKMLRRWKRRIKDSGY